MTIETRSAAIVFEPDLIRWREFAPADDPDEYRDLLWEVDEAVREHAPAAVRAAWERACAQGRAPDADMNIDGWRVVLL